MLVMTSTNTLMNGDLGSRCPFPLSDHAPRVHLVLVLLPQAGEIVDSETDNSSLETCHDREAGKMAKQRMVGKDQIPMAAASWGRRRPELTRYVEKISASRQVERDLCRD